jgi:dGTPase
MSSPTEYERWLPSQPEADRSEVVKDRDRIIHSSAFRRLQGKSQVFGAQTTDFFRNRLTHSLECAQIGHAIATRVGGAPWSPCASSLEDFATVVEAACLAHDIGHPPFGHNGEEALSGCLKANLDGHLFEGNAQSFRIVTYVEPKQFGEVKAGYERWLGLNLTRTTLKAIQKYPWIETDARVEEKTPKFSVFDDPDDHAYFDWVWGPETPAKTLATEIMDVADDIAYATHDLEDGVWSGMIPLYDLVGTDDAAIAAIHRKLAEKDTSVVLDDVGRDLSTLLTDPAAVRADPRKYRLPEAALCCTDRHVYRCRVALSIVCRTNRRC